MSVAIYGLFKQDSCFYVGVTMHPRDRLTSHQTSRRMRDYRPFELRIIEIVPPSRSAAREVRWIRFYKEMGQADENVVLRKLPNRRHTPLPETLICGLDLDRQYDSQYGVGARLMTSPIRSRTDSRRAGR